MSWMRRWMQVLISVFVVSVKLQVEPVRARSDRHQSDAASRAGGRLVTGSFF